MPTGLEYSKSSIQRIDLYKAKTRQIYQCVELIAGQDLRDFEFWREARAIYAQLIVGHNNFEIAETFFNSVYCAVLKHRKIRDEYAFVFSPNADMPSADVEERLPHLHVGRVSLRCSPSITQRLCFCDPL